MKKHSILLGIVAVSLFAIGCGQTTTSKTNESDPQKKDDPHAGHDHAADDHTPKHGGHLIEIGRNHEYHAELVDDHKTESVTIYMMDSHMEPLTLKESSISLVLTAGDKTETFELLGIQPGGSASFSSNDAKLMAMIEGEDVKGKVRVNIDGKPYSGAFEHHGHGHVDGDDSHAGHNH